MELIETATQATAALRRERALVNMISSAGRLRIGGTNFEKVLETEERTWHSRIEGLGFPAKCVPEAEIEFPRHVANENGDNASTGSLKTVYKGYAIRQTHCLVDSPAILPRHALYRRQCEPRTNQLGSSVFSLGGISR